MNLRLVGAGVAALGVILTVVGVAGLIGSSGGSDPQIGAATAQESSVTTRSPESTIATTTQPQPTTTPVATTQAPPLPSTTAAESTTTTEPASALIADFVQQFAEALETQDREFVLSRLHPTVVEGFGDSLCAQWIDDEIMTLSAYELTSTPVGPTDQSVATPNGNRVIPMAYRATTRFVFQGSAFEGEAGFALIDGLVYWLGQCR